MGCRRLLGAEDRAAIMARLNAGFSLTRIALGLGLCCWHFVKRVCVPAASEVPVRGTRRRLTPEYRRDVASLVLDTGSTNCVCGPRLRAGRIGGGPVGHTRARAASRA